MDLGQMEGQLRLFFVLEREDFFGGFGVVQPSILFGFSAFEAESRILFDAVKLREVAGVQDFVNRLAALAAEVFFAKKNVFAKALVATVVARGFESSERFCCFKYGGDGHDFLVDEG